jgi:hypothetical protein
MYKFNDEIDELFENPDGLCQGCDIYRPVNDIGLCDDCAEQMDRDLIRQRDWEYSSLAFCTSNDERMKIREQIIKQFGAMNELIAPTKKEKKKSFKKRKRKKSNK